MLQGGFIFIFSPLSFLFIYRQKLQERKQANESLPFYEWAVPLRNNPKSYSCRYCRVRISKNYSKKQHASSKIHQINESIFKNNRYIFKTKNIDKLYQTNVYLTHYYSI